MHWFFPGLFFGPAILFFGFFKLLFFVLLIVVLIRIATHGRHQAAYAHGYWQGQGSYGPPAHHGHAWAHGPANSDPRRIAAWRFAAGRIDRAEFDRIMTALDASETTPPAPPAPPVA